MCVCVCVCVRVALPALVLGGAWLYAALPHALKLGSEGEAPHSTPLCYTWYRMYVMASYVCHGTVWNGPPNSVHCGEWECVYTGACGSEEDSIC